MKTRLYNFDPLKTKGKRKVKGVPQSQTAALPRPQEEEETNKSKQPHFYIVKLGLTGV